MQRLVWEHKVTDRGLGALDQLRTLHLWRFNPKHRTFAGLELPRSLTELQINWANPASLDGLPELPHVTHLEIHRCRNLESIAELARLVPNIEHLVVAACGRVADGAHVVKELPKLKHAYVGDSLLVTPSER